MIRNVMIAVSVAAVVAVLTPKARAVGTAAGQTISNQAYGDYEDANGNALPRVYSNEVETVVSQVANVDVAPDTATKTGEQGTPINFPADITNLGNGDDTFDLTANNADGWTATIYKDLDQDGILDPAEKDAGNVVADTGTLAADDTFYVIVVIDAPEGTANGTSSDTTLTAASQFDGGVTDAGIYTTEVTDAVLDVAKAIVDTTSFQPGDIITYAMTGNNTGSAVAEDVVITDAIPANTTYVSNSVKIGPVGGTYATADAKTDADDGDEGGVEVDYNITNPGEITVVWGDSPPGDSGVIYFQVTIDSDVSSGTTVNNTADIDYSVGGTPQPTVYSTSATFDVENLADILLDPDRASSADPGDQVEYIFTAYNNGNAADVIELTYGSASGWTWTFYEDDGDGVFTPATDAQLTDTNNANGPNTASIPSGGSVPIWAVATVPAGTSDGTVDTTTVTGTSVNDPTVTDPEVLTTTVTAPVLTLTKTVTPTGNQPPGTELTYLIEAENTGTGSATAVVVTDIIPEFTTYVPGSLRTGSALGSMSSRSDANDGDGARYDAGAAAVFSDPATLGAGGKLYLEFRVTID